MCIRDRSYTDQECDAQGRVLLPAKLRSMMLGEEKDVDIMGNDDHLRVAATINNMANFEQFKDNLNACLLYTSPSPRDRTRSRMPSSA